MIAKATSPVLLNASLVLSRHATLLRSLSVLRSQTWAVDNRLDSGQ